MSTPVERTTERVKQQLMKSRIEFISDPNNSFARRKYYDYRHQYLNLTNKNTVNNVDPEITTFSFTPRDTDQNL